MAVTNNIGRIFEEVVSIEAWHSKFDQDTGIATVHADVSFLHAKLGDESECPVRFDLAIKRAELQFIIPLNEPLAVLQSSVSREQGPTGQKSLEVISHNNANLSGSVQIQPNAAVPVSVTANAGAGISQETKSVLSLSQRVGPNVVKHFSLKGNHCWEITAARGEVLLEKPWDPNLEPRLRIKRTNNAGLEPSCRFLIKCRREDISITNVAYKAPTFKDRMAWQGAKNKEMVAAAYIKDLLFLHNLDPANFDEQYATVLIADVAVAEEVT